MKLQKFNKKLNEKGYRAVVLEPNEFDIISCDLNDPRLDNYDYYAWVSIDGKYTNIRSYCPDSITSLIIEFNKTPVLKRDYNTVYKNKKERDKYWNF